MIRMVMILALFASMAAGQVVGPGSVAGGGDSGVKAELVVSGLPIGNDNPLPVIENAFVSVLNSTSDTLAGDATFTGTGEDCSQYASISVTSYSDVASADDGLRIEFSSDNANWDRSKRQQALAAKSSMHVLAVVAQYCRVVYINGSDAQSEFRLQVLYHPTKPRDVTSTFDEEVTDNNDTQLTRGVVMGRDIRNGTYSNVRVHDGALEVDIHAPRTAFGQVAVSNETPIVQGSFLYNINSDVFTETELNSATADSNNGMLRLQTGTNSAGSARVDTKRLVHYRSGQGLTWRYTCMFTTGAANSTQICGAGNVNDGVFWGYNGASFGILHRHHGLQEVATLTVSTASNTNEDITITLNSVAVSDVSVTNSNVIDTTAAEIAAHDYSGVGSGWDAFQNGATVVFLSRTAEPLAGTYSLSGASTAVGSFADTSDGATPTESWVAQASFNKDNLDGTGPTGMTIDPTKLNVYQIDMAWLGAGRIEWYVLEPTTGQFTPVHLLQYTNANTQTHLRNPSFPMHMEATNSGNTSNLTVNSASVYAAVQGGVELLGPANSVDNSKGSLGTALTNIVTIRNKRVFQGVAAYVPVRIEHIGVSVDHTKPGVFELIKNTTLGGTTNFDDVNTNTSVVDYDTAGTTCTGGEVVLELAVAAVDSDNEDVTRFDVELDPGDTFSICYKTTSGSGADAEASITWEEEF